MSKSKYTTSQKLTMVQNHIAMIESELPKKSKTVKQTVRSIRKAMKKNLR